MAEEVARRRNTEPTFKEWHAALIAVVGDEPAVQRILEHFLRTSDSGKAYLEGARRLRPSLTIGRDFKLDEAIGAYDAMELVSKLIAEPRCGADPEFFVWKDIWKDSNVGASELYGMAIEISQALEARSESEAEKTRLQQIRVALENELHLEQYNDWRREAVRGLKS